MKNEGSIFFEPKNLQELTRFLDDNEDKYHEIWIVLTKKKVTRHQPVSFVEVVNEAVKRGLVDNRTKSLDDCKYSVRFTKRANQILK